MNYVKIGLSLMFMAISISAYTQTTPGYLGKKNIFTYEYQTSPNISEDMIEADGIGVLQVLFKNRHFLGYEHVLNRGSSVKFDLGYSTPTFSFYSSYIDNEYDLETNKFGMITSRNLSLGVFYRKYSFLSPLNDYIGYGVRLINVSVPEGMVTRTVIDELGNDSRESFQLERESRFTAGVFLQVGKTKVIKDVIFIDTYVEFGLTYFDMLKFFDRINFDTPIDKAMGRTFRYNLLNVGISIGLMN